MLPLAGFRVLDLSDHAGAFCARVLGEFGAEVIKIEAPGGGVARSSNCECAAWANSDSVFRAVYDANKRGITLDIEAIAGRRVLQALVEKADFLVDSFPPGYLAALGLGYEDFTRINPRLIQVSITPFGQDGPHRDYASCDLVFMATGGFSLAQGDDDRAPLRISEEQSYLLAGLQGAAAAMIAHVYRQRQGPGQRIDLSIFEAIASSTFYPNTFWEIEGGTLGRAGARLPRGAVKVRAIWKCKDGYVAWRIWAGKQGIRTRSMVELMNSQGMGGELSKVAWQERDFNSLTQAEMDSWGEEFARFFATRTKAELYQESLKSDLMLFPLSRVNELLDYEQLKARGFWTGLEHPGSGARVVFPALSLKTSLFSAAVRQRAPLPGEHNNEVYRGTLGFSPEKVSELRQLGVI